MKRLLWLGIGLAVGALVVRAVTKKARSYTPQGIAAAVRDSGRNAFDSVRDFVDDVRDSMHDREDELLAALAAGRPVADLEPDAQAGLAFDDDAFDDGTFAGGSFEDELELAFDEVDAAEGTNR